MSYARIGPLHPYAAQPERPPDSRATLRVPRNDAHQDGRGLSVPTTPPAGLARSGARTDPARARLRAVLVAQQVRFTPRPHPPGCWCRPQPRSTQTAVSSSSAVLRAEADAAEAASLSRRCARSAALATAASRSIRSVSSRIRASLSTPVKPVRPNLASRASCDTAILPSTAGPGSPRPTECGCRTCRANPSPPLLPLGGVVLIVDLVDPLLEPFTGPLQPDTQIEPMPVLPYCGP